MPRPHDKHEEKRNTEDDHFDTKRETLGRVFTFDFLLATLIAMVLSTLPAGADVVPASNVRAWGYNGYGQLGNGNSSLGASGQGVYSDIPVAVKYLTNAKNIDGGYMFTLATTFTLRATQ